MYANTVGRVSQWTFSRCAQSLDAGSVAALPEGLRVELEGVEDAGGVRFLQEMAAQLRVREHPIRSGEITHMQSFVKRQNQTEMLKSSGTGRQCTGSRFCSAVLCCAGARCNSPWPTDSYKCRLS